MGVPVKAIKTIMRGQTYLPPGTVFEYPDQASADYAIGRGMVTPHLEGPIKAVPEYEVTPEGKQIEATPEAASDAPPASFVTDPAPVTPAAPAPASAPAKGHNQGKRR